MAKRTGPATRRGGGGELGRVERAGDEKVRRYLLELLGSKQRQVTLKGIHYFNSQYHDCLHTSRPYYVNYFNTQKPFTLWSTNKRSAYPSLSTAIPCRVSAPSTARRTASAMASSRT